MICVKVHLRSCFIKPNLLYNKAIEIENDKTNDIVSYFELKEFVTGTDVVLTKEEDDRLRKLFT